MLELKLRLLFTFPMTFYGRCGFSQLSTSAHIKRTPAYTKIFKLSTLLFDHRIFTYYHLRFSKFFHLIIKIPLTSTKNILPKEFFCHQNRKFGGRTVDPLNSSMNVFRLRFNTLTLVTFERVIL